MRDGGAPTSPGQEALWLLWKLEPASGTWNNAAAWRLDGPLDVERLRQAWRGLISRHVALAGRYVLDAGHVERLPLAPGAVDLAVHPGPPADLAAAAWAPFDLERGPVARLELWRVGEQTHVLLGAVHHVASDGPSMRVLAGDLARLYAGQPLPPLTVGWDDAVARLRTLPRPAAGGLGPRRTGGRAVSVPIGEEEARRWRRLAARLGVTLATLLQATFRAWAWRLTGEERCAVPMVGRTRREWNVVGYFTEAIDVPLQPQGAQPFAAWVAEVDRVTRAARRHPRPAAGTAVLFNMLPEVPALELPGLQATPLALPHPAGQAGVALTVRREGQALALDFSASEPRWARWLETWTASFPTLLRQVEGDASLALGQLSLVAGADQPDRARLTADTPTAPLPAANQAPLRGRTALPHDAAGVDAARPPRAHLGPPPEALVARWSDGGPPLGLDLERELAARVTEDVAAPAVVDGATGLTWSRGRLERFVAAAAQRLAELPVRGVVAIEVERSPYAIALLLACLRTGQAWWFPAGAPLDALQPVARLWYGKHTTAQGEAEPSPEPRLEVAPLPGRPGEGLAFALLTSGTTGAPRPVRLRRVALEAYVAWFTRELALVPADRVLQFQALSFDGHAEEILPALCAGATLVLRGPLPDARGWVELLAKERITVTSVPTGYFNAVLAAAERLGLRFPPTLRACVVGGELLSAGALAAFHRLAPGSRLLNTYGPSEATIAVASSADTRLGRPIPGATLEVVDGAGQRVPPGVVGALRIGGAGLADGEGPTLCPGDLAAWDEEGQLEFHGRGDAQVKWRGLRFEPLGVEQALEAGGASPCLVRLHAGFLVAWTTGLDAETVRGLLNALPVGQRPSRFALVPHWPLTAHGKTDVAALLEVATQPVAAPSRPPRSPPERATCQAFAEVLRCDAVGLDDDFFELGGDSLLGLELCAHLEAVLARPVSLEELELRRTPASMLAGGASPADSRPTPVEAQPPPALHGGGLDPVGGLGSPAAPTADAWRRDVHLLDAWSPGTSAPGEPGHTLITGAAGLLGIHLLWAWLAAPTSRATCLVRASSPSEARSRLADTAARHGLDLDWSRVHVQSGSLASLVPGPWAGVLHAAATTDLRRSYASLRGDNVEGTANVLRLGLPTLHVSTAGADLGEAPAGPGYVVTKWVAERLVTAARARGARVWVCRPGRLWGNRLNGATPPTDALWRLVEAGRLPLEDALLQVEPVDDFARAVVAWFRSAPPGDFTPGPTAPPPTSLYRRRT